MTIEEAKMYVQNYPRYEKIFGIDVLTKCLEPMDMKSFSTFEYVERDGGQDRYYASKGYPVLCDKTWSTFKEYHFCGGHEWSRDVRKLAREYRIPCRYQLAEEDLLRACLLEKFPYLKDFDFPTYHLDREDDEIYIKCENGCSLYAPIRAFVENDFSIIVKRHTDYHKEYYRGADRKQYLDKELAALENETALRLKEILNGKA